MEYNDGHALFSYKAVLMLDKWYPIRKKRQGLSIVIHSESMVDEELRSFDTRFYAQLELFCLLIIPTAVRIDHCF